MGQGFRFLRLGRYLTKSFGGRRPAPRSGRPAVLDRVSGCQFPFFGPKFQGLRALVRWSEYSPARSANGLHLGGLYEESDPGRVRQGVGRLRTRTRIALTSDN